MRRRYKYVIVNVDSLLVIVFNGTSLATIFLKAELEKKSLKLVSVSLFGARWFLPLLQAHFFHKCICMLL